MFSGRLEDVDLFLELNRETLAGGVSAQEIEDSRKRLQKREELFEYCRGWAPSFRHGAQNLSDAQAREFLDGLLVQLKINYMFRRPLLCGHILFDANDWRNFPYTASANDEGWFFMLNVRGGMDIRCGSSLSRAAPGDLVVFPPQCSYAREMSAGEPRWEYYWFVAQPSDRWLQWLGWVADLTRPTLLNVSDRLETLQGLCREICELAYSDANWAAGLQENLFEQLLLRVSAEQPEEVVQAPRRELVAAQRFIQDRLAENLSVAEVAEHCQVSSATLNRLFRQALGCTPMQWRDQQRMEQAAALLRGTSLEVGEISAAVGYPDSQHFTRRFRSFRGMTPLQYRRGVH